MFQFTIDQLYGWIAAFIWPLARILSLLGTAPIFGDATVPTKVKMGLGVLLTLAVAPALGPMPAVPPASFAGMWIIGQQVVIGAMLGLCMRMIFGAVQTAGEFIGLQMGLSFASFFDPSTNGNTAVISRLLNIVTILVFLALDGHLLMLAGIVQTFQVLPISDAPLAASGFGALIEWSGQVMVMGLLMALPFVTALLTMNLAMGILNRTAPQLSVFAVGFPLSLLAGLVMLAIVLPQTTPFLERLFNEAMEAFARVAELLRSP